MDRRQFLLSAPLLSLAGCFWNKHTTHRSQTSDGEEEFLTVGDVSMFDNATGIPVSGVGLIIGLDGTGGSPPPGDGFRAALENQLRQKGREDIKQVLDSPNHAVVLVSAMIPAGARKGDLIDLEVSLPQGSKAKSLRGGYLLQCDLVNFDTRNNVRGALAQADIAPSGRSDALLKGHTLVIAEGPLHAPIKVGERAEPEGAEADDPSAPIKFARIWSGGKCLAPRPFYLVLNGEHQRYRVAIQAAERINETFHCPGIADKLAEAKTKENIILNVPAQYRLNLPHFLRVVRAITLERQAEKSDYVRKLEEQLQEPGTAIGAALRLEAMGPTAAPILNAAKDSSYPLVRFAAAEALAYMDEPGGAEELARLAIEHPALQAYCLTALAALGEAASDVKLRELLACDKPHVRYGAFRALRSLDSRSDVGRGEAVPKPVKDEDGRIERPLHWFYVHELAPDSQPLVHALTSKRAEFVMFGQTPKFTPGTSVAAAEFTVTMRRNDTTCTVSRFSAKRGRRVEQCPSDVVEVLRKLADMGATYAEAAHLLRQADRTKSLSCPFAMDALPQALTLKQLAEQGKTDPTMEKEAELLKSSDELGTTPTLYEPAGERIARR